MILINEVFNEEFYLEINPEARESVDQGEFTSGLKHFLNEGIDQGLQFSPFIDLDYYKRVANPDLSNLTNREALDHLFEVGIEEGRLFSPFVDLEFYKDANPDLADLSNSEALLHLQDIGLEDGRQFASFVDLEEYRSFNPELATQSLTNAFINLVTEFAPEDEGRIQFPLNAARTSFTDEVDIVTQEMLSGSGNAEITYSKLANTVTMDFDFTGLPYRLDITRPENVSTPYNQFPISVENGKWQILVLTNLNNIQTTFWYDGQDGQLIGNEFDVFDIPPDHDSPLDINNDGVEDTPVLLPTSKLVFTPIFEGNPDGTANVTLEFAYDQILDEQGKGGTFFTFVPYNINKPDEIGIYYTQGGLPISEAPSWDDVLETIRNGGPGFSIGLALVPDPKPDYLASRSSLMIGYTAFYPDVIPEGVIFEPILNLYRSTEVNDLSTNINEPSPARLAAIKAETEAVFGTLNGDVFDAVDSRDEFDGNHDLLFTGEGDDLVDASQASAPMFPSTVGNNRIFAGSGRDELFAGSNDRLSGGRDNDILDASLGAGNNRLYGGEGDDLLFAGIDDRLFGGHGNDQLDSSLGRGNNRLYGQEGDDIFIAGSDDKFFGGDGDDTFFVTDGNNNIFTGGSGNDSFWIVTTEFLTYPNTITDFEVGVDVIGIGGIEAYSIEDIVLSQVHDDTVISFSDFEIAILQNTEVSALKAAENAFIFA
ncbi:MAG: calcium-binding protein [Moorea sp. SIOASIH]|uniref:calcium-binding protein n=1 Tax=Moorena sp. SIOASIH TaxID=2607817 RepID=UPI0013BB4347|nr:calcium-binding protein [Moorena sp. SIOASIH]NEO41273.1 calcium-binding protein [Moorena sp. SIOASIH]